MSNQEEEKVRVRRAVRFGLAVRAVRQCQSGLEVFTVDNRQTNISRKRESALRQIKVAT